MQNKKKNIELRTSKTNTQSSKEDIILLESARIASSKAVRSSMALGITIKVIRNREILAINPDRTINVLRKITKSSIDISSLKKGMILERK